MKPFLKKLLRPSVVIPLLFTVGIVAALLTLTDIRKVVALMASFQRLYLLYFLLLMIAYEVVRAVQWAYLLRAQRSKTPLRAQIFAFAVSEVTKALPIGNYVQNYLLQEADGEDFGRTSAITTLIIFIEVGVSLLAVVILGDGAWTLWLRIGIPIGVLLFVGIALLIVHLHSRHDPPTWMTRHKSLRTVLEEFRRFREGARDILHLRTMVVAVALGALYLTIAALALYIVTLGLNIPVLLTGTLSVYFLSLAVGLIFPLPVDIGILELSMLGAFVALGVSRNAALGASLVNRVLSIASSLVIALVVVAILYPELRKALRGGKQKRQQRREGKPTPQQDQAQQPHGPSVAPDASKASERTAPYAALGRPLSVPVTTDATLTCTAPGPHSTDDATVRTGMVTGAAVFGLALALTVGRRALARRRTRRHSL
ncbi:MAG: lysylphosphatidylglycerol synthase transmembrane domain-containing protein [Ktedonobacterales bacterium]